MGQAIDMVCVPVPEMLGLRMHLLNLPKDRLLMRTVLKETYARAPRARTGFDDPGDLDRENAPRFAIGSDHAPTGFIVGERVALVEYRQKCGLRDDDANLVGRRAPLYPRSARPHTRHPF